MTRDINRQFHAKFEQALKDNKRTDILFATHGLVSRYLFLIGFRPGEDVYLHMYQNGENMAKKFSGWTMINARLSKNDKEKFHKAVTDSGLTAHDAVIELLGGGYKVSVSFVVDRSSFVFTVTGPKDHRLNAEKSMTSWSDDLEEAMYMGWYKVRLMFADGEWTDDGEDMIWG